MSFTAQQKLEIEKILIDHEGSSSAPYFCPSGKLSIGVGRNLEDVGLRYVEIMFLLRNDIEEVCKRLDDSIPWWQDLTIKRKYVLVDMTFNLGISGFLKFKKTLAYIKAGDYHSASIEMLNSRWAEQVKSRAVKLSQMMEEG